MSTNPQPRSAPGAILFVGNLLDVKAPDRALAAFAELASQLPDVRLDVVGDGPLRRRLERQVAGLGLSERVSFHGRQPPATVAEMMRKSACLCLPSRSEGMPNVVLEALACGTPVVATPVGEAPVLVRDGVNGFVVRADKVTEGEGDIRTCGPEDRENAQCQVPGAEHPTASAESQAANEQPETRNQERGVGRGASSVGRGIGGTEGEMVRELAIALRRTLSTDWDRQAIAKTVAGLTWKAAAEVVVKAVADGGL